MKIIILHEKYGNEPIVIRPNAIAVIRKFKDDKEEEYSRITVETVTIDVKENMETVINKIKEAESEDKE